MTTDLPLGRDALTVVALPHEVDLVTGPAVRDALLSTVNRGDVHLAVDASATTFLDSAGVNALVRVCQRLERLGGSVHVVTQSRPVLRVLALTQVDRVLAVVPSLDDARRCVARPSTIHTCRAVDG